MKKNRLEIWYRNHILNDLLLKNPGIRPQDINKDPVITINISSKNAVVDKKKLIPIVLALELITGQSGILTKAKCSLASFRLKKGMELGVRLTLQNNTQWNFLDKWLHIVLPSLVHFHKAKEWSYDLQGNLAIGLTDINSFPEIDWLRDSQHPLAELKFITGATILISWPTPLYPKCKSYYRFSSLRKNWVNCHSSGLQIVIESKV